MKTVEQYLSLQPEGWQKILADIHSIIIREDVTVVPVIEVMMRNEMIVYKAKGMMKYALAGNKNYMSLHNLSMYGSPALLSTYKELLPLARFQKGCINFISGDEMPLSIVQKLIADSSAIDLLKIREDYLREKKLAAKTKKKVSG